jgi:hypothetical protein
MMRLVAMMARLVHENGVSTMLRAMVRGESMIVIVIIINILHRDHVVL